MTQHLDVERLAREAIKAAYGEDQFDDLNQQTKAEWIRSVIAVRALVLEEAAKRLEAVSHKSRWITAGINSEEIKLCEYAAAIRALAEGVR